MPIGRKMGSMKELKKSLAKGGGAGFIKYVPKNGSLNVRFLDEPENWVNYAEHYDQVIRKSYPCNGEDTCPGCKTDERRSSRYLANAVDLDQQKVIPLQMPKDLANRLVVRYEKKGSLTDCDIELSRAGEGLDTVYDYDADAPKPRKVSQYVLLDLLNVLDEAFNSVFGDDDDDDDDDTPAKPVAKVKGRKPSKAAAVAVATQVGDDDDDDEDDDDEPVDEPVKPTKKAGPKVTGAAKKAAKNKPVEEPVFEEDDDDADDDDDDDTEGADTDDEADDYYDQESLEKLSLGELRAVARDYGIVTRGMKAAAIITAILEAPEDDDADDDDE